MSFFLQNKKTGVKTVIPTSTLILRDEELPYTKVIISNSKYEKFKEEIKETSRETLKKMENTKLVVFKILSEFIPNCVIVMFEDTTWHDIKSVLIENIRNMEFDKPDDITDIALSPHAIYVRGRSKIIDTRDTRPYDVLHTDRIVYVNMFRRSIGWKPIAVGYQTCETCGNHDGLKRCKECKMSYYCSFECQKADWKDHKNECRNTKKN